VDKERGEIDIEEKSSGTKIGRDNRNSGEEKKTGRRENGWKDRRD
jgi:hypothetical protein